MSDPQPITVGQAAGTDSKRVKVLLGVAALLLVGSQVVPRVLGGGGDDASSVPPPVSQATTTTTAPSASVEAPAPGSARNPFQPTLASATAPPAGTASTSDDTSSGSALPSTNGGSVPVFQFPAPTTTPTTDPPVAPTVPVRVQLYEVDVVTRVLVDGTFHEVRVGDEFDGFRLESIDLNYRCAALSYGIFTHDLCEGDQVEV